MENSIWDWIYRYFGDLYDQGQDEMVEKLDNFSSIAYDKDQDAVEAAFPELIAFARSEDNKWLEIYLRHWRMQSYVNTNHDPRKLVPEVLDLLAFCQDEDTKTCPQSVCVIDDITDVYAAIDAPGFAPERCEMLEDTLRDLSPGRECYQCMTLSYVDALTDQGQPEKALEVWKANSKQNLDIVQGDHFYRYLASMVVRSMINAGHHEDASELIEKCTPPQADGVADLRCLKVRNFMALGKVDKARTEFDALLNTDIDDIPIAEFICAVRDIGDEVESCETHLLTLANFALERGRMREAFDSASLGLDMAVKSKQNETAQKLLNVMSEARQGLHRSLGADETLQKAKAVIF